MALFYGEWSSIPWSRGGREAIHIILAHRLVSPDLVTSAIQPLSACYSDFCLILKFYIMMEVHCQQESLSTLFWTTHCFIMPNYTWPLYTLYIFH
jgi:hypothetical protein